MDNTFRAEAESELELDEFFESDEFLSPQENGGQPTHEIYLAKDDTLLYSNGDK